MLPEQENVVNNFKTAHSEQEKLILYGTGINAEAVVKNCTNFQIVGLMDATKTGQILWGLPVLSEKQIVEMKIKKIVIVARPAVHIIIYKRIKNFVEENNIVVYDIYGNDISKIKDITVEDSDYFYVSYEDLKLQTEKHDIISFDIFDTLLCRKVYQPQDVFRLMKSNDILEDFAKIRESAEQNLEKDATIYDIYDYIKDLGGLSEEAANTLLLREIHKEKQVLCARQKMVDCFHQCIQMGKGVYLVTDMYMPQNILKDILQENNIVGYKEILVSCEHKISKKKGLFKVLKSRIGSKSCIHIGDNHERDYVCAKRAGIDAFEIMSPIKMMEISTYRSWLSHTISLGNRTIIGLLTSVIFNDPFSLYKSNGKPIVDTNFNFGYIYIAPLVTAFTSWLVNELQSEKGAKILFAARDGYLFQKSYKIAMEKLGLIDLPKDIYFLISRKAIQQALDKVDCENIETGYANYIRKMELDHAEKVFFFDFMSKGTCQLGLQKILGYPLIGIYVQRSLSNDRELNNIFVNAFYEENSAMQGDKRLFAMCDFLECIFTSFSPSLKEINVLGEAIYEEEVRSNKQLVAVEEIQTAILKFVNDFFDINQKLSTGFRSPDLCDEILRGTQSSFARICLPDIENMCLDDALGICKNTGIDILQ